MIEPGHDRVGLVIGKEDMKLRYAMGLTDAMIWDLVGYMTCLRTG